MKRYTTLPSAIETGNTVVTLGKFDGVHRGHRKLLARVHELARRQGLTATVFTFTISPQVQMGERTAQMLMTQQERADFLREQNIDLLVECPFTEEIRTMEAEDFVRSVLTEHLRAKALVVGTDFRFGKDRKGTPAYLESVASSLGFDVEILEKEKDAETGREISSTFIREELAAGKMEKVQNLLGYPYFVSGQVIHGRQLGQTLGFPTINLHPASEKMLPPYGVYLSRTRIGGKLYQGISNIGIRPTVGKEETVGLETYLFDCSLNLYEQEARVELLRFHRPEQKFASLTALQHQIQQDIGAADRFFSS